jgi:hypothetical protein
MISFTKHALLIVLMVFASKALFSQDSSFDTANVVLNAKMNIVSFESSNKSREEIINIIDSKVKYKVIESKGFSNDVVFFHLVAEPLNNNDSSNYFFEPINQYNSSFIFAYNSKSLGIYRLKGFKENDFITFFNQLDSFLDLNISSSYDLKTKKRFLKAFYIEGVDLDCLYDSLKTKNKKGYDCLKLNTPVFNGVVW